MVEGNNKKYNIIVSCSEEYFYPLKTTLYSLLKNNNHSFHIFFLGDLAERHKKKIAHMMVKYRCSIDYIYVDNSIFKDSPNSDKWFRAYYKIMIPWILPKDIRTCLWLDSDIIIQKDIISIFDYVDNKHFLVGCSHNYDINYGVQYNKCIDGHQIDERMSLNSGVLIFNIALIKERYAYNQYIDYFLTYKNNIVYSDQDFFNSFFREKIRIIEDNRFNYLIKGDKVRFDDTFKNKNILHYYWVKKPWNTKYYSIKPFFVYWRYGVHNYNLIYASYIIIAFLLIFPFHILKRFIIKLLNND